MKRSTPTTPRSYASSQSDAPQASPRNYAPHISDPDPPDDVVMTDEEIEAAGKKLSELMRKRRGG